MGEIKGIAGRQILNFIARTKISGLIISWNFMKTLYYGSGCEIRREDAFTEKKTFQISRGQETYALET